MNDRNRLQTLSPSPASPPPLSRFVSPFLFPFSPLFVSYSDLRVNSIPGPVSSGRAALCARKNTVSSYLHLFSLFLSMPLPLSPPFVSLSILHCLHRGRDKSSIRLCSSLHGLACFL